MNWQTKNVRVLSQIFGIHKILIKYTIRIFFAKFIKR